MPLQETPRGVPHGASLQWGGDGGAMILSFAKDADLPFQMAERRCVRVWHKCPAS